MKNYYQILGLAPDATAEAIGEAYRMKKRQMGQQAKSPDVAARLRDLNEAYDTLSDAERRAQYDARFAQADQKRRVVVAAPNPKAAKEAATAAKAQPKPAAKPQKPLVPESVARFAPWLNSPQFLPTLGILVGFMALTYLFFQPLYSGYMLPQGDLQQAAGMQKGVEEFRERNPGQEPYWTDRMFSGMPTYTFYTAFKGNLLDPFYYVGLGSGLFTYPGFQTLLGLMAFFFLLRVYGVRPLLSAAGAIAFVFFSYYIIIVKAGHSNKFIALMYAPAVVAALRIAFMPGRVWLGAALFCLFLGLEVTASHFQMTYYLGFWLLPLLLFEVWQLVKGREFGRLVLIGGLLGVAALGAGLLTANKVLPMNEYTQYSIRGPSELERDAEAQTKGLNRGYAYEYSYGRSELLALLIPNAKGGASGQEVGPNSAWAKLVGSPSPDEWERNSRLRVPFALNGQITLYWGNLTFTEGPFYAGAAICFLFVLGLCLVKGPVKWGTLYAALFAMLLGTGGAGWSLTASLVVLALPLVYLALHQRLANVKPEFLGLALAGVGLLVLSVLGGQPDQSYKLADFFFDYVPLYTKFRAPSTFLVLIGLTFPLLGLLAVQRFLSDELTDDTKQRALLVAAGVVGGLCLVLGVAPGLFFDFKGPGEAELLLRAGAQDQQQYQAILADRASVLQADAWRSLAFVLLTAGLLFAWLKGWLRQPLAIGVGLLVIVLADNLNVSRRYLSREDYLPEDQYTQRFAPQPADQYLQAQDTSYYRVFRISRGVGAAFNEAFTSYHLRSIGGYNAAKIRRYQQLFERHLSQLNPAALNMLNTRYIISSVQNHDINRYLSATGQYDTIFAPPGGELVFYNKFANPPAWLVDNTIVVPKPDDALDTLGRINPYVTAVVEEPWAAQVSQLSADSLDRSTETIRLEGHELNYLRYKARTAATRLAVFSEIYYPGGWKATINGQPTEILQVNFVLRGVVLPPGEHTIEFRFAPDSVQRGALLSWIGTGIMLLLLVVGIVMDFRRNQRAETPHNASNAG